MSYKEWKIKAESSVALVVSLLIAAVFIMEIAVGELSYPFFSAMSPFWASLSHSGAMTLLYAVPLWVMFVLPLFGGHDLKSEERRSSVAFFLKAAALIFLVELVVIYTLPHLMPGSHDGWFKIFDAGLDILISVPLLWWLLVKPVSRSRGIRLVNMLETPVKLYIILLFVVFMGDFAESILLPFFLAYNSDLLHTLVDNFVFTLISAPFLWLLIMRPLQEAARSERDRCDAIRTQVIDAIITVDKFGVIDSFNPSAERIFGYQDADAVGGSVTQLLGDDNRQIEGMIAKAGSGDGEVSFPQTIEVRLRRSDGSQLVTDVSASRVVLEGRQNFMLILRDVTERKEMVKALRESEERLNFALNGANDGIWDWNMESGEIFYSPRLREMLGYANGEMGNSISSFVDLIHPDDRQRSVEEVQAHLKTRTPFDTEYRLRTKWGDYRWFGARGQAMTDESGAPIRMAGSISDITRRKEAEKALNETLLRFRQLFEQIEDAIFFFKPGTCQVIDANLSAEKLYGYTKRELLEIPFHTLCSPAHFPMLQSCICNIRQGEMAPLDNIINFKKDGTEIIVSMRGKVISLQGEEIVYCTFRDVSERIRLENEAKEIQANLIQTNKMTSLGLMVSGVAHEINNPNNFIMANLQFLDRAWKDAVLMLRENYEEHGDFLIGGIPFTELEAQSNNIFSGMMDGSKRIKDIVTTLKRFARQEKSSSDQLVDINETVRAAISILRHEIVKYTESFQVELGDSLPLVVGNNQQLCQVIINLLLNACQSLPSRHKGVWISTGCDEALSQVIITVRDEGVGVSEEMGQRILEPFFTTKLDSGGTGLGLAISSSIIKDHNGAMEFESEQGNGTTFAVRLPAAVSMRRNLYSEAS